MSQEDVVAGLDELDRIRLLHDERHAFRRAVRRRLVASSGSNAARAAAALAVSGKVLPQNAGGLVAFVHTRKRPRFCVSAVTAPRMSRPIVCCDQRGRTAAPNRISWPLGNSMFVSQSTLSACRPPLPATLTRVPAATSSAVRPKRLTMLTEFDSMSQSALDAVGARAAHLEAHVRVHPRDVRDDAFGFDERAVAVVDERRRVVRVRGRHEATRRLRTPVHQAARFIARSLSPRTSAPRPAPRRTRGMRAPPPDPSGARRARRRR